MCLPNINSTGGIPSISSRHAGPRSNLLRLLPIPSGDAARLCKVSVRQLWQFAAEKASKEG